MKNLKAFDSSYLRGKNCFEDDDTQNYLVFQPSCRMDHLVEWKSKGLFNESIKVPYTDSNFLGPLLDYLGNKIRVKFSRSCLKEDKAMYNHGKIVNT